MSDSLKDPLVAGLVAALEGKADEVTIRIREEDPDPREETALSPMLRAVRAATSGTDSDALAMVAEHLGVAPSEVKKWESGEEPIPEEIANKLSMRKGGDTEGEFAGCRDEWIIGKGTEIPGYVRRRYLIHTQEPRFICRVMEWERYLVMDGVDIADYEEPKDVLGGLAYCEGDDYTLIEFQWLDPIPDAQGLLEQICGAIRAHDSDWEAMINTENVVVGMGRAFESEERLSPEEAIAQIAKLLEAGEPQVKQWMSGAEPLTAGVLNRLRKPLSSAGVPDGALCRDEWLSAFGPELANGKERWYLVHAWKPRFICRIVEVDPEAGVTVDWEHPVDDIGVLTYGVDEETLFCEFQWLDDVPTGQEVRELLARGVDAIDKSWERDALEILDAQEYGDEDEDEDEE